MKELSRSKRKEQLKSMKSELKQLYGKGGSQQKSDSSWGIDSKFHLSGKVDQHIMQTQNLFSQLIFSVKLDEEMKISFALASLPEHFSVFAGRYSAEKKTLTHLLAAVQAET